MSVNKPATQSEAGASPMIVLSPPVLPDDGDEDALTIYRLENECYNLKMCMSKVRKATQEWFLLETKLKNALDELDAAKEDRDLMLSHITSEIGVDEATNETKTKRQQMELDLQRIEGQLNDHPKFSPEWFKLKEELVELRIKLVESDPREASNKVIEEELHTPSKKQSKENENFNQEFELELPPQFHFRPISPPPPLSSPSTSSSLSVSKVVQPYPDKPITGEDGDDPRNQLRAQHAEACKELDKSIKFSQEWFTTKLKAVQLEDKLQELDDNNNSFTGSNLSFTGWSENEEEVEAISCADELECVMVAEALKQGCCVSPSFVGDGGLVENDEEQCLDTVDLALALSADEPEEGELNRLEPKHSRSLFGTEEMKELYSMEHQSDDDEPTQHQMNRTSSDVYPMHHELNSFTGNADSDQPDVQNHHAIIIQKQWRIHSKCRPYKRMKSRALNYQRVTKAIEQEETVKNFRPFGLIRKIMFPVREYCQWEIFAAILIQNHWKSYQKRKQFRATVSSNTQSKLEEEEQRTALAEKSSYEESNIHSVKRELKRAREPPTLETLSVECSRLTKRLNQLPKFSPEWTLVNVELKLVTEEMEYLLAIATE